MSIEPDVCEMLEPETGLKLDLAQSKCSVNVSVYYFTNSSIRGGDKVLFEPNKAGGVDLLEFLPETLPVI